MVKYIWFSCIVEMVTYIWFFMYSRNGQIYLVFHVSHTSYWLWSPVKSTAVPFWGQTALIPSALSLERDYSPIMEELMALGSRVMISDLRLTYSGEWSPYMVPVEYIVPAARYIVVRGTMVRRTKYYYYSKKCWILRSRLVKGQYFVPGI